MRNALRWNRTGGTAQGGARAGRRYSDGYRARRVVVLRGQIYIGAAGYTLGPNHSYLRYAPGTNVLITCLGSGLPVEYFGPIVKTVS